MKKKLLLSVVMLFAMSVLLIKVNAATTLLPLENSFKAKAPSNIPADGADVKATVTETFDFSKMTFKASDGTSINGIDHLRKILVGVPKSGATYKIVENSGNYQLQNSELSSYFSEWFTAYCLDSSVDYPYYGVLNNSYLLDGLKEGNNEDTISEVVRIAIQNSDAFKPLFQNVVAKMGGNSFWIEEVKFDTANLADMVSKLKNDEAFTIKLNYIKVSFDRSYYFIANDSVKTTYSIPDSSVGGYLTSDHSNNYVNVPAKLSDLAFHNYVSKDVSNDTSLNHALWIVEHSYPTIGISETLSSALVNEATLDSQIRTLYEAEIGGDNNKFNTIKENLIFATIQYAVWNSVHSSVEGNYLGNEMTTKVGTADFELNKLYAYLVKDRAEYNGYADPKYYSKDITVVGPTGDALYKTEDDAFIFGPYKATYNAVIDGGNKIQINITNENKTGISIINDAGQEITQLDKDQKYYVKVSKKANIGTVTYTLTQSGVVTFSPASNRARVYSSKQGHTHLQNVMSGGKIYNDVITGNANVDINAKTGVENIALLLMVTLVAFTLGYLVLSYKQKPIGINQ